MTPTTELGNFSPKAISKPKPEGGGDGRHLASLNVSQARRNEGAVCEDISHS